MVGTQAGAFFRTRSQTLTITASSSKATPSERPTLPRINSLSSGTSVPLRRHSSQKTEAATLTATLPSTDTQVSKQVEVTDFEDYVTQSSVPVLVDFYAPWCGPCQLMSKVIVNLSGEMKGRMQVVKINTDNYPKLASKYRVKGLPTCLLFRDGQMIDRVDGFMPEDSFGKRVRFYVARLDTKFGRR